jgi:5-methylcytosine-specific restriction endonuclease McrA
MITKAMRDKLAKRDPYCMHCGETDELVVHHRKNRGMGGSPKGEYDRLSNLMRVCSSYNNLMESSSGFADIARERGHKLRQWDNFDEPALDECTNTWYLLDDLGNKTPTDEPFQLF